jgi:hypothetical protein
MLGPVRFELGGGQSISSSAWIVASPCAHFNVQRVIAFIGFSSGSSHQTDLQTVDMGRRRIPLRRIAWPTDPQGLHWKEISNEKKARANGGLNPHLADVEETFIKASSSPTNDVA